MYQTRKLIRAGLSLAVLAAVSGIAIPQYAKATPVLTNAAATGRAYVNRALEYNESVGSGSATTLFTGNWSYTCPVVTCARYGVSGGGSQKVAAGALGAQSNLSVTGTVPVNFVAETLSDAWFSDNLTIAGGSGSGVLALNFTVDGSVTNSGGWNEGYGELVAGGALSTIQGTYSSLNGGAPSLGNSQYFGTQYPPPISPNVTVNFWVPFTFGTQFSFSPLLYASSVFAQGLDTTPYTATTNFYDTAAITSALVYDGTVSSNGVTGSLVNDASILSEDGFSYGPDGLSVPSTAVPEPGELPLFVLGLGFLGLVLARRRFPFRRRFPR